MYLVFWLLTGLLIRMVGELTHMRSMCVGVAETGVEHCSPAKNHKVTFSLIALLNDQKRGKNHQRELSSLFEISPRVHELVARAMRGKCVRYGAERKSMVLPLLVISNIPRVRTYHTR